MTSRLIEQLSTLVRKAYQAEMDLIHNLSEGERTAEGSFENWAPKDTLAHTTYWRRRTIETLAYAIRNQPAPEYPPYDQVNREVFFEKQSTPLQGLIREAESTLAALLDVLKRFEDSDLTDPNRYPWRKGVPLMSYLLGNAYIHVFHHLAQTYLALGDSLQAARLQEEAARSLMKLDHSEDARGVLQYDIACLLAGGSDPQKAFDHLAEAFRLKPDLIAWSKQDPDLEPLRAYPRYDELTAA